MPMAHGHFCLHDVLRWGRAAHLKDEHCMFPFGDALALGKVDGGCDDDNGHDGSDSHDNDNDHDDDNGRDEQQRETFDD